jgi:hypothetical protein
MNIDKNLTYFQIPSEAIDNVRDTCDVDVRGGGGVGVLDTSGLRLFGLS